MNVEEKEVAKNAKRFSIRFLLVVAIFLASLSTFVFIADEIVLDNEHEFDYYVFDQLAFLTTEANTSLMLGITFFGSSNFLFPAYTLLVVYFLTFGKNRLLAINIAAVGITSRLLQVFLKSIFQRKRPLDPLIENVDGYSFPSGHSFSGFTFFGLLIYILWNYKINIYLKWTLSVLFFLFACAIAFSRVYLHVHYASDVIGGMLLCIVWLSISFWLLNKLNKKYEI